MDEETRKQKNREYQRKHRENKINEIGQEEFRKQVAQQVAKHRENKKDDEWIINRAKQILNKLPNEKLINIKSLIDERVQPRTNEINTNNKKYCQICNIYVFHSNFSRHKKTAKHLSKEMDDELEL